MENKPLSYNPQEIVPRFPLELDDRLHINLYDEAGKYKHSLAYFTKDSEGYQLLFVGNRPFNPRVNWDHFRELARNGQLLADLKYLKEELDA